MWITTDAVLDRKCPRVPAGSTRLAVSCSPCDCAKAAVAARAARMKSTVLSSAGFLVCFMALLLQGGEKPRQSFGAAPFLTMQNKNRTEVLPPGFDTRAGSAVVGRPVVVVVVPVPVPVVVAV